MVFCRFCCCCSVSQTRPSQFSPEGTQGNTNQPWRRFYLLSYTLLFNGNKTLKPLQLVEPVWKHSPVGFLLPIMRCWSLLAAAELHNRGKSGAPVEIARVICVILHSPVPHPVITQLSPFSLAAVDGVEARIQVEMQKQGFASRKWLQHILFTIEGPLWNSVCGF